MRLPTIFAAASLLLCAAAASADPVDGPTTRVVVDGVPRQAPVVSLEGTPETPRADDVIRVREFLLTRGDEADLRFRIDDDKLWQIRSGKPEALVAVRTEESVWGCCPPLEDKNALPGRALAKLDAATTAGLRGVTVAVARSELVPFLDKLDLARCVICVQCPGSEAEQLAVVPRGARFVAVDGMPTGDNAAVRTPVDLAGLAGLPMLRYLALDQTDDENEEPTHLDPLATSPELRVVEVFRRRIADTAPLSKLMKLRVLELRRCSGPADCRFATSIAGLRSLSIEGTPCVDLAPLGALRELRDVAAGDAPRTSLPAGDAAALRRLDLCGATIEAAAVEAFAKAHAAVRIDVDPRVALARDLDGCDAVRVFAFDDHGTDQRRYVGEFPAKDAAALAAALTAAPVGAAIDPEEPGWGQTTVVFLRVGRGLATVDVGPWSLRRGGRVLPLGAASRRGAADWLVSHGVPSARAELDEVEAVARDQDALVGADVAARARYWDFELLDALLAKLSGHDRALLGFRMIGASAGGYDGVVAGARGRALDPASDADLVGAAKTALADAATDPAAYLGLAHCLLEGRYGDRLASLPADTVEAAARRMLADPREDVRRVAVYGLQERKPAYAAGLLRPLLPDPAGPDVVKPEFAVAVAFALAAVHDEASLARAGAVVARWGDKGKQADLERLLGK